MKQFGGVTGDTSGFFLQICELACLIGAWIGVQFV
jgi:adenosylcobinamide-GDP ribazoletransferase